MKSTEEVLEFVKRAGCFDIGLKCGGWGKIVMELKVVDSNKIN